MVWEVGGSDRPAYSQNIQPAHSLYLTNQPEDWLCDYPRQLVVLLLLLENYSIHSVKVFCMLSHFNFNLCNHITYYRFEEKPNNVLNKLTFMF